jgi:phosphoribosylformylglycinamidine synthase
MFYKIEIQDKSNIFDAAGAGVKKGILDLGISNVRKVSFVQVYNLEGNISDEDAARICQELLTDRICQDYFINRKIQESGKEEFIIEVAYNPGVMDPVEESTLKGIKDLGIEGVNSVKTAKKYIIRGKLSPQELKTICDRILYNKLIQHIVKSEEHSHKEVSGYSFNLTSVDLLGASDNKLKEISKKGQLFLNLFEMSAIKSYFKKLNRNPGADLVRALFAQDFSRQDKVF